MKLEEQWHGADEPECFPAAADFPHRQTQAQTGSLAQQIPGLPKHDQQRQPERRGYRAELVVQVASAGAQEIGFRNDVPIEQDGNQNASGCERLIHSANNVGARMRNQELCTIYSPLTDGSIRGVLMNQLGLNRRSTDCLWSENCQFADEIETPQFSQPGKSSVEESSVRFEPGSSGTEQKTDVESEQIEQK